MAIKLRQTGIVVFSWCSLMAGLGGNCSGNPFGEIVMHVDNDAPANGDGLTWESAYRFLQDAMTYATQEENDVSEIKVAQGIYQPDRDESNPKGDGDRERTFQLINGVSLLGGYAGIGADNPDERDIEQFETILSGDLLSDDEPDFKNNDENSYHVVTGGLTDNSAVIEGFTITAGNADGSWQFARGAGMANFIPDQNDSEGSPVINLCVFKANWADSNGGGLYNGSNNNTQITNCTFSANRGILGGGISNGADDAIITDCLFIENIALAGGGIAHSSNGAIISCDFVGNSTQWGGGMILLGNHNPLIVNCHFFSNESNHEGGGMYIKPESHAKIVNCHFSYNSAGKNAFGGGIYFSGDSGSVSISNLTIANNIAGTDGGIYFYGYFNISNSIIWGNKNGQISNADNPFIENLITYNCIEGGYKGTGNIDADPLFVDPGNDDFRLMPDSPCIDSGLNNVVPHDVADLDNDEDFNEFTPFDLDENPRFVDDPDSQDSGCGVQALVDMGAFEFQDGKVMQPLPGDFDGDGAITDTDLIELLSEWGQCDNCCLADLDANGSVNTNDLLIFLSNWN